MKKLKEFLPLWKLIKEEKVKLIIASILTIISGVSSIFAGYLNGAAVESITKMNLMLAIKFLLIYFAIEVFIQHGLGTYAASMLQTIESKLSRKLGYNTYKKALNMPAVGYEKTSSGEIINRITNDSDSLSFIFGQLLNIFTRMIGALAILIYIFFNSIIIGVNILVFLIIFYFVIKKYAPLLKEVNKERKKQMDVFTSLVNESIRGIREIKTLGIKKNLLKETREIIKELFNKSKNEIDILKKYRIITGILRSTLEVSTFIICIILLYYKQTSLTFFIAMTYYVYNYTYMIEMLNDFTQSFQRLLVSIKRINEILENKLYKDVEFGDKELKQVKGVIEFKGVDFAYPDEDLILKDFNIKLKPNKKIAIVGKSGGGKSTIFNLLTRIFDPQKGEILLDGVNIKDLTESSLRKEVSIIRQEPFIFHRTIRENFTILDKNITLEEIKKYCKIACLDDYIESLPNSYDTLLGEGGVNLSGGQKQRLAIARTLAKKSKIILLDEATSALDNNSQNFIKEAIDNLVKDHTVIIVAHRLSTIKDADIIYVINNGKVVAKGNHNYLLKTNKEYKKLYENESLNSEE